MVATKPGHQGELEVSRKTIARGMPDVSGATVVTNACAYYQYTRGCGRARRPAFPAPSFLGGDFSGKPRAKQAGRSRRHFLPSLRAQRSNPLFLSLLRHGLLRFARNDEFTTSSSRRT